MRYFVFAHDFVGPEAHLWDVYIGDQPPEIESPPGREFESLQEVCQAIRTAEVDQVTIFRAAICPETLVEELARWIEGHTSFKWESCGLQGGCDVPR